MPEAPGAPRLVRTWRPASFGAAPDVVEVLAHRLVEAARARGGARGLVWLDSGGPARGAGAESVLTAFPVEVRRFASGDLVAFLDRLEADDRADGAPPMPPADPSTGGSGEPGCRFRGGWLGHLSYECAAALGAAPLDGNRAAHVPLASWALHPVWVRVDHDAGHIELWSRLTAPHPLVPDLDAWVHWIEEALRTPFDRTTPMRTVPPALAGRPPSTPDGARRLAARAEASLGAAAFTAAVRRVQGWIHEGEVFQANIANRFRLASAVDPFAAYVQLRRLNPSPFALYIEEDWGAIVSNSPERLVAVERTGGAAWVSARPIAGTRPRGGDVDVDRARARDLTTSEKERAEHTMLVDLARNDLGRICVPGSVRVRTFQTVERYSHVQHLVSDVEGRLAPGVRFAAVVAALFPGGTITGAPKLRAVEVIGRVEPVPRGPYTGSAGYLNPDGSADLNILIRTLVFARGAVDVFAGAGVVADSDPMAEFEETLDKAAAMLTALATVEAGGAHGGAGAVVEVAR